MEKKETMSDGTGQTSWINGSRDRKNIDTFEPHFPTQEEETL